MKPDYGLHLLESGMSKKVEVNFYDFRLYNISVIGDGQYTTMVDYPRDGKLYALSLDFNQAQLEQILAKAPPARHETLKQRVAACLPGDTVDLNVPVAFGFSARLGDLQGNGNERYVPLIAQSII